MVIKDIFERKLCEEDRAKNRQVAIVEDNNSKLSHMDYSPAQLFFGRNQKTKCITTTSQLLPTEIPNNTIRKQKSKIRERQKYYYDRSSKLHKPFKKGDNVLLQNYKNKWWEPAKIIEFESHKNYVVENSRGNEVRRNSIFIRPTKLQYKSKQPINIYNYVKTTNPYIDHMTHENASNPVLLTNHNFIPQSNELNTHGQQNAVPYTSNESLQTIIH